MAFTTQIFIFFFFPISFLAYYICCLLEDKEILSDTLFKYRIKDICLICVSLCFYMWAFVDDAIRFLIYIIFIFFLGNLIEKLRKMGNLVFEENNVETHKGKISLAYPAMLISVSIVIAILVHFKYTDFITDIWNYLFKEEIEIKSYAAPLGISFITFSAISYLVDIYTGMAPSGNLVDCMLYFTFFPKVISGPIVLWRDFAGKIKERKICLNLFFDGITRIMLGFAKKVILADTFGECISMASGSLDAKTFWGVSLLYMLQIYYDFSGYSDIAIGLSNMFGFEFNENFNFPYLSLSIAEFWRRWHISLGAWFREYVYFPLGGSKKSKKKTLVNIAVVFLLTGIWHGTGLTYLLWGILNGACCILERLVADKQWYKKIPKIIKWIITMGITFLSWELFRFNDISSCIQWFKSMMGINLSLNVPLTWRYYFDLRMTVFIFVAIIGATLLGIPIINKAFKREIEKPFVRLVYQIIVISLFVISIMFMVNSTYSPFIYFRY